MHSCEKFFFLKKVWYVPSNNYYVKAKVHESHAKLKKEIVLFT